MLFKRERGADEVPIFGTDTHKYSANFVADATMRAVDTIRYVSDTNNVIELAKVMSAVTKKDKNLSKSNAILQDIALRLDKLDHVIIRRRLGPDVTNVIRTHSAIPKARKDKAVAQWKEVLSALDRQS